MSHNKNINDILYLINKAYHDEFYESNNFFSTENDDSIYVRKFTIKKIFRDRMTLWCHNDAKLYTWNYKSKLLLKQRCNNFAFIYDHIEDDYVGEYLFIQSKAQSILRNIQFDIIDILGYKKFINEDDYPLFNTITMWTNELLKMRDALFCIDVEKVEKYVTDNK